MDHNRISSVDTNYLQGWKSETPYNADDLHEILAQFDANSYLNQTNIFGGNSSENQAPYTSQNPTLMLPDMSAFFPDQHSEEASSTGKLDRKRKATNTFEASTTSRKEAKKGKQKIVETIVETIIPSPEEKDVQASNPENIVKRRENHNATERRRREKINEQIDELRKLLPGGGKGINKAAVLNQTAERIHNLQTLFQRLVAEKQGLESSRSELLQEVNYLRHTISQMHHGGYHRQMMGYPNGL